jgi:uncharacterized protein (DUF736 family)
MIIGNFVYDQARDTYTGTITTLTVEHRVVFHGINRTSEKGPDYRIMENWDNDGAELGAAWKRTSETGQAFLSVLIDDPALPAPINAAMFRTDSKANLVWSRTQPRPHAPASEPGPAKPKPLRRRAAVASTREPVLTG